MGISALLALALLLLATLLFAALSKRLEMSVVTMPLVFTGAGYLTYIARGSVEPAEQDLAALRILAEVTLVLLLFSDASRVSLAKLRKIIGIPARMLLVALPLSLLLGTLAAYWVSPDQPLAVALLIAAILTPTDAALGQAVVNDPAIPERLREGIIVESGLNDGLTLPIVIIAALAAVEAAGGLSGSTSGEMFRFGAMQVVLGPLAGVAVGLAAARLLDFADNRGAAAASYKSIYFLCCAFLCYVTAELIGGNGLIAAFIGGLTFGNTRKNKSEFVAEFMESEGQLLTMLTFIVFGAILAPIGFAHASWKTAGLAVAFLTLVRIVPVVLSLTGTGLKFREKLFLGWFGPRGLASILFALFILETYEIHAADEMLACVVLTVLLSILVHGVTAFPIARAFARTSVAHTSQKD